MKKDGLIDKEEMTFYTAKKEVVKEVVDEENKKESGASSRLNTIDRKRAEDSEPEYTYHRELQFGAWKDPLGATPLEFF